MAKLLLLDALSQAGENDLAAIDAELVQLGKRVDMLTQARKLLDLKINGKPERKKPTPRAKPASTGGGSREQIGKYLLHRGPTKVALIAMDLKMTPATVYNAVDHAWFTKTPEGIALSTTGKNEFSE